MQCFSGDFRRFVALLFPPCPFTLLRCVFDSNGVIVFVYVRSMHYMQCSLVSIARLYSVLVVAVFVVVVVGFVVFEHCFRLSSRPDEANDNMPPPPIPSSNYPYGIHSEIDCQSE